VTGHPDDVVKVTVNRASVAAGDDVDSHREFWVFPASATVDDLLVEISTHYLPGVAGPAGWQVYSDIDDEARRRVLGLIYTRDDLKLEDLICRLAQGNTTLGSLARLGELDVHAGYLTRDEARPVTLGEVTAGPTFTGSRPTKLESEAARDANTDWVLMRELDRQAAAVAAARRDWIRANIVPAAVPPPGADVFIARNFHVLTRLHCYASMNIAASLLGTDQSREEGLADQSIIDEHPATATLVMVLAAFEWGCHRQSWRTGELPYRQAYLEFLAYCGYRLSPIEQVMAGHLSVEEFTSSAIDVDRLDRIRRLREQQYQLRVNRYYAKTLTEEQYQAAIQSVHAELTALGELPGPV
jgi:hypothetical protein